MGEAMLGGERRFGAERGEHAGTSRPTGAERIDRAFGSCSGRAALMPYLMGGYPDLQGSLRVGEAYAGAGADLVEVGVPFSDPLADGPVIQAAGTRALAAGATFETVLDQVAGPLAGRVPVVVMCYANPIYQRGFEAVAARLAEAAVAGLIVPDLPVEEAAELRAACDRHGIALVPLLAPNTPSAGVEAIAEAARGFVYVVSVTGVTGERGELPRELHDVAARVRDAATVPAAVGFGVATPEQVAEVGAIADGVIVGSRLVRAIAESPTLDDGLAEVDEFLRSAARALA
jgi:tryptophan synthase alpha chain